MGACCGKKKSDTKDLQINVAADGKVGGGPSINSTGQSGVTGSAVSTTSKAVSAKGETGKDAENQNAALLEKKPSIGSKKAENGNIDREMNNRKSNISSSNTSIADQIGEHKSTLSLASSSGSAISAIESTRVKDESGGASPAGKASSALDAKDNSTLASALEQGSNLSITGSRISSTGSNLDIVSNATSKMSSTGSTTGFNYEISVSNLDSSLGSSATDESSAGSALTSKMRSAINKSKASSKISSTRDVSPTISASLRALKASKASNTGAKAKRSSSTGSKDESVASADISSETGSNVSIRSSKVIGKRSKAS